MDFEKYIELFSKERIESYRCIKEHNQNLIFIQDITLLISLIELILRNKIDNFMSQEEGNEWVANLIKTFIPRLDNANNKLAPIEKRILDNLLKITNKAQQSNQFYSHPQIISKLNFGFWVDIIFYMIDYKKFDCSDFIKLENIVFNKYDLRNKLNLNNNMKIKYIIKIIQKIRNRAFHWENLLKETQIMNSKNKKIIVSGIYVRYSKTIATIAPNKIKIFLFDTLNALDKNIYKELEDFKKESFETPHVQYGDLRN